MKTDSLSNPPSPTAIGIGPLTRDLTTEIFHLLPVKTLLCMKAVSKTWCSLISHPSFVKSHLIRSLTASKSDQTLIVHSLSEDGDDDTSISLLNLSSRRLTADLFYPCSQGEFSSLRPSSLLVGSALGLVCVCLSASDDKPRSSFLSPKTKIYIWNPATKQSKLIPPVHKGRIDTVAFGFGFDPLDEDFKVVRVQSSPYSADVYSLKRNVWNTVEKVIDVPYDDAFDVCVNGVLCCTGSDGEGLMAFDLHNEVLNCAIKFPVETFDVHFIEVYDCVGAIVAEDEGSDSRIRLWKLEDDACLRDGGVEASWTLMLNVKINMCVPFVHGYFNGGDLLMLNDDGAWFLYNKDKNEAYPVPVLINTRQVYRYTESLISIAGSEEVIWDAIRYY